jgi:flagellar hook assembly protein FlgD
VISYQINQPEDIKLKIYDATGRLVTSHKLPVASHCFIWDGRDNIGRSVSPGVYFIRLETDDFKQIEKVIRSR